MSDHTDQRRVVVLGAGVIGLTTALELSRQAPHLSITVVAKHMPGDYDIEYASPWAGADYVPFAAAGTFEETIERSTWPHLERLARKSPEAGIHFQTAKLYSRKKDSLPPAPDSTANGGVASLYANRMTAHPWYADLMPDFRALTAAELPPGHDSGTTFTSVVINTAIYLPWLASSCLSAGVILRRGIAGSAASAASLHHSNRPADVVLNCTGLGSRTLRDVAEPHRLPARGQIVVVRNEAGGELAATSGTDDGGDESCYVMQRAAGGGTVLGGCYQKGAWESAPDADLAVRIMSRAVRLAPALTRGKGIEALSVVRHAVGLRPVREGGTRIERQSLGGVEVVHCYGHGGYGYQSSWGSAKIAVRLALEALGEGNR